MTGGLFAGFIVKLTIMAAVCLAPGIRSWSGNLSNPQTVAVPATESPLIFSFWLLDSVNPTDRLLVDYENNGRHIHVSSDVSTSGIVVSLVKSDQSESSIILPGIQRLQGWKHLLFSVNTSGINAYLNGEKIPEHLVYRKGSFEEMIPAFEDVSGEASICYACNKSMGQTGFSVTQLHALEIWHGPCPSDSFQPLLLSGDDFGLFKKLSGNRLLVSQKNTGAEPNRGPPMPRSLSELSGGIQHLNVRFTDPSMYGRRMSSTMILDGGPLQHRQLEVAPVVRQSLIAPNGPISFYAYGENLGCLIEGIDVQIGQVSEISAVLTPGFRVEVEIQSPFAPSRTQWIAEVRHRDAQDPIVSFLSDFRRKVIIPWVPKQGFILDIHDTERVQSIDLESRLSELQEGVWSLDLQRSLESFCLTQPTLFNDLSTGRTVEKLRKASAVHLQPFGKYLLIGSDQTGLIAATHDSVLPVTPFSPLNDQVIECICPASSREMLVGTRSGILKFRLDEFGEISQVNSTDFELFSGIPVHSLLMTRSGTLWVATDQGMYFRDSTSDQWREMLHRGQSVRARKLKNAGDQYITGISSEAGPFRMLIHSAPGATPVFLPLRTHIERMAIASNPFNSPAEVRDYLHDPVTGNSWVAFSDRLVMIRPDWTSRTIIRDSINWIETNPEGSKVLFGGKNRLLTFRNGAYHQITSLDSLEKVSDLKAFSYVQNNQMLLLTDRGLLRLQDGSLKKLQIADEKPEGYQLTHVTAADTGTVYFSSRNTAELLELQDETFSRLSGIPPSIAADLENGIHDLRWNSKLSSLSAATASSLVIYHPSSASWHRLEFTDSGKPLSEPLSSICLAADGTAIGRLADGSWRIWTAKLDNENNFHLNESKTGLPPTVSKVTGMESYPDRGQRLFGTGRGVFLEENGAVRALTLRDRSDFFYSVSSITPDQSRSRTALLISTSFGLYRWDPDDNPLILTNTGVIHPRIRVAHQLRNKALMLWNDHCTGTLFHPDLNAIIRCENGHPLGILGAHNYLDSTMTPDGNLWLLSDQGAYFLTIPYSTPAPPSISRRLRVDGLGFQIIPAESGKEIRISATTQDTLLYNDQQKQQASSLTHYQNRFRVGRADSWKAAPELWSFRDLEAMEAKYPSGPLEIHHQTLDPYLNASPVVITRIDLWQTLWSRNWVKNVIIGLLCSSLVMALIFWWSDQRRKIALKEQKNQNFVQLKAANERLQQANANLKAAQESKDRFLACMSHEIRTPMNGILGMTELMLESGLNDEQRDYGQSIQSCAQSLLTIINDILDISKIEAGKVVIEQTNFDFHRSVEETTKLYRPVTRSKQIDLRVIIDQRIPRMVKGDPTRIKQILNNFLNNAIKFTDRGHVTLNTRLRSDDGPVFHVDISVSDTGIGIPPDKLDSIFETFSQVDASTTRKYGGTGLGLSICRRLAELMGGEIRVQSVVGQGSNFSLIIPLDRVSQEPPPGGDENTAKWTADECFSRSLAMEIEEVSRLKELPDEKYRQDQMPEIVFETSVDSLEDQVLVVEDNRINQRLMLKFLSRLNLKATVARNGQEAVEAFARHHYPFVLMDCQMPVMDGYTATAKIRELTSGSKSHPVIIALTANAMASDREKCLDAGMDDYLAKPVSLDNLRQAFERNGLRIFA